MKRLLLALVGVIVLAAAGLSGFWFWNRGMAKEQIEASLVALSQAGVETRHEGIEIAGFPTAYEGRLTNFTAKLPDQGVAFAFPEFRAGMSATSIGTVDFTFPAEFFVNVIDASGAPTGDQMFVASEAMIAAVSPAEGGGYDLALTADRLRVSRGASGDAAKDHVSLQALAASGKLTPDQANQNIVVDVALSAAAASAGFLAATEPGGPTQPIAALARELTLTADGDLRAQKASLSAATVELDATPNGGLQLTDIAIDLDSASGEGFEPAELLALGQTDASAPEDAFAQLLRIAAQAVLQGGVLETNLRVGKAEGSAIMPVDDTPQVIKIALDNLAYRNGVAPERIGSSVTADTAMFTVEGPSAMSYDVEQLDVSLQVDAADKFDFTQLLAPLEDETAAEAALHVILAEIAKGGSASLASHNTRYTTETQFPPELGLPFQTVVSRAGENRASLTLDADMARISMSGEDIAYETKGGVDGSFTNETFTLEVAAPVRGAPDPQDAQVGLTMDGLALSDSLWALLDPENALTREIKSLTLDGSLAMRVEEDLLTLPRDVAPPVSFEKFTLKTLTLDLLGFRGDATGEVGFAPAPNGEVVVTLKRWRELFEGLQKTPLRENPQAVMSLLIANNWLDTYGQVGAAEDETVLNIAIDPATGVSINGQPLQ